MKIGAIQMTSLLDYKHNLGVIKKYLIEAKSQNLKVVFLPEFFYSMSEHGRATPYLVDMDGNEHFNNISDLARDFEIYLLGGSAASIDKKKSKIVNRCYNFGPDGKLLEYYDKINLFKCDLSKANVSGGRAINEGDVYERGNTLKIVKIGKWKLALSLCFDVRFPEVYRRYSASGANIFSVSAAFTVPTGKAHWESLLRARAIENQSYLIATAQWGVHNETVSTYGHSMIIDPWGEILANAKEGEKLISADIHLERVCEVRSRMDVLATRKKSL